MARKRKSQSAMKDPDTAAAEDNRLSKKKKRTPKPKATVVEKPESPTPTDDDSDDESACLFLGEPVPDEEARNRWPQRYENNEDEKPIKAKCHFLQAKVDEQVYNLEDHAHVQAEAGKDNYICKIVEFFQAVDGTPHLTAQWYYRTKDTAIGDCDYLVDKRQIFFSELKNDNPLGCLVKKLRIEFLPLKVGDQAQEQFRSTCDYFYDKMYHLPYTSFVCLPSESTTNSNESGSTISSEADVNTVTHGFSEVEGLGGERTLLDLYSGCGAMSTGLCLGANSCGVKLVTKWAVDLAPHACESLKLNHPETQVRNETAEDFLHLLKEWKKLCTSFLSSESKGTSSEHVKEYVEVDDNEEENEDEDDPEVYEVEEILGICYGDPNKKKCPELHFKIRWKGYSPDYDTWEPLDGLSSCPEKLKEFVLRGHKSRILPLPGTVDVLCGGPPCQGISGYNRFRNEKAPLEDPKNKQLLVYMDIVAYLRPRFVLMENVVDLLKFAGGFLGRYAMGSLVSMGYQTRMGLMAAGAYGLPQFRMRVFLWGALSTEKLPPYPLPTHNVVGRRNVPTDFESNAVTYEKSQSVILKKEFFLHDAISDLPHVENNENRDEIPYDSEPQTDFQRFIRQRKDEMPGCSNSSEVVEHCLYDHRPLCLNTDDFERVCQIPKKKGANFRDLPGVRVRPDNKVEWDPDVERKKVSSGKPLVPDYAMSFVKGTSSKPFGRLWWDEAVPTVVTRAEPHNHALLHPNQDRVLTIRENARLQGFPDYYKLLGPIKERYMQVGNAVAVPVARALGYSLALALRGLSQSEPTMTLPENFPMMGDVGSPTIDMI